MRVRYSILLSAAALSLVVACGGGGDSSNGTSSPNTPTGPSTPSTPSTPVATNQVDVGNNIFSPSSITVPVNTNVTWTWSDDATLHNVTGAGGLASGDKSAGGTYTKLFTTAGTFSYSCTIHPGMTGSVLVTP